MAVENNQSQEVDLERTDRLPILEGAAFDEGFNDDAVRMDGTASLPTVKNDFPRPSGVDLPSLAESVRSVEERIARQAADYDALNRSYAKAQETEAAAIARSQELAADLAGLRATLEAEQKRSSDSDKALAEKIAAAEATRSRIEDALRDAERYQSESHTLRDTLAAREATISQVLHSLGERDAQLAALQTEHAKIVPVLEERSKTGSQLESDLRAARARSEALAADLQATSASVAALTAQLKEGDKELSTTRQDLGTMKVQATSYLEQLRTRDWRRGFDHNLFRELDAEIGAARNDSGGLQSERDALQSRLSDVENRLVARDETIARLKEAASADEALRVKHEQDLQALEKVRAELAEKLTVMESERSQLHDVLSAQRDSIAKLKAEASEFEARQAKHESELSNLDGTRAGLVEQIAGLEKERTQLQGDLAKKDVAIEEALAAGVAEAERIKLSLAAAAEARAQSLTHVERLQAEAKTREDEMGVLMAQLHEARRPISVIEAEVKRLSDELTAKTQAFDAMAEENRNLRLAVERTKGALEEREFLIRRLERSESNNANVLGRIQTSIERLGTPSVPALAGASNASQAVEVVAEMIRTDGERNTSYTLARRTRIGRAPGCELQIESSSVSRHHALVLVGQRDVIIEDLNSTNGVLVNGRKIARQLLGDGDSVTIGEAQFRFQLAFTPRVLEGPVAAPSASATPAIAAPEAPAVI
jgi:chromosome segregation ATPase